MQKTIALLLIAGLVIHSGCTPDKKTIHFSPMSENEFSMDTSFVPPGGQGWNAIKKMHDSCMGLSFAANAYFVRTKDSFSLGCVVNTKTMRVVKNLPNLNLLNPNFFSLLNVMVSKPCYNTIPANISVDSLFRQKITFNLLQTHQKLNDEFNGLVRAAVYTQAEAGSWTYVELTDAVGKLLDTTKDIYLLQYKQALLQPGNMVLIRSGGITNINFKITTSQAVSAQLKAFLSQKPVINIAGWDMKPQLFDIDDTHFELNFTGYFR